MMSKAKKTTENKRPKRLRKILKWMGIFLLGVLIILIAAPYLFKDKIQAIVLQSINEQLNAEVSFEKMELSLLQNFPQASLSLHGLTVKNNPPFKKDTLLYTKKLTATMASTALFNASKGIALQSIAISDSKINIYIDQQGRANYDITKKTDANKAIEQNETDKTPQNDKGFSLKIHDYNIENLSLDYVDKKTKTQISLSRFNHRGAGDLNGEDINLKTKTTALVSMKMDSTRYLKNTAIGLDAVLGINLKTMEIRFKDNKANINQLGLAFDGSIQILEKEQRYNLTFKTPTASFKNLLGLVPEKYAGDLSKVNTKGTLTLAGAVTGVLNEKRIPNFDLQIKTQDAMFKYKDLPKAVENIVINTHISNETGHLNDTQIKIQKMAFKIDDDAFTGKATISNIAENPNIALDAKGIINLKKLRQSYPVPFKEKLSGTLNIALHSSFDMNAIKNKQYQRINNVGKIEVKGLKYTGTAVAKPVNIQHTALDFSPQKIVLKNFDARTGDSDLHIRGTMENFYGFLFSDQELRGDFTLQSKMIKVSDFIAAENPDKKDETPKTGTTKKEAQPTANPLKIPAFLNCNFTASAEKVIYDDLNLAKVVGKLNIKNQQLHLTALKMNVFEGQIQMNGTVNTQKKKTTFKTELKLHGLNVSESFTKLKTLQKIAPIAGVVEGKLHAQLNLMGALSPKLSPEMNSLSGTFFGHLKESKLNPNKAKMLSSLNRKISLLNFDKVNLDDVNISFKFDKGQVIVAPFTLKYQDVTMRISGRHGFDQQIDYKVKMNIPTRHLGSEVAGFLTKLKSKRTNDLHTIPVTANLTGSFKKPKVGTDLKEAKKRILKELLEQQKQSILDKGADLLKGLFN